MHKFKKDWNKYHLNIDGINLQWSDVDNLSFYATLQSGQFGKKDKMFSKQTFFEEFPKFYNLMWSLNNNLGINNIQSNSKILDIGSGISIIDLLLLKKDPSLKFFLLDKEELTLNSDVYYSEDYFFYNTWECVKDCLQTTNLPSSQVSFLQPADTWPEDIDVITSYFSWCMHYPKEVYWRKVLDHLSTNGMLVVDVRNLKDRNVVEEISDELKIKPKTFEIKNSIPEWIDNYGNSILGWRCVWNRRLK